jgi:hypothetical protein
MIITATSVGAGLTSCDNKDLDTDIVESSLAPIEVKFDLHVGTSRSSSSISESEMTDVDIEHVEGTYAENYVDTEQLHLYFFNNSSFPQYGGQYESELTIKSAIRIDATTYRVIGTISALPTTDYFRVAVTANWPYPPTLGGIMHKMCSAKGGEYQYHYGPDKYPDNAEYYTPSEETPIPMFGAKRYTRSSFSESPTAIDLGTIYLMRAMVKLIVKPDDETDDIEKVTLATSHNVGMCGPINRYDDDRSVYNDSNLGYIYDAVGNNIPNRESPSGYGTGGYDGLNPLGYTTNLPFKKLEDGRFLLYIPAFNNTYKDDKDSSGNPVNHITVTFENHDYTIEFKDDDTIYDLYRNTMYVYTVKFRHSQFNYSVVKMDDYTSGDIIFK